MGKSRESLRLVANEMFAVLKSMTGIAVMIGGGLIPFFDYFFKFVQSPWLSVVITLLAITIFQAVVIIRLAKRTLQTTWFDREYFLFRGRWKYTLDDNLETLSGEYEGERHFKCLNRSISHLDITVNPAESLIPFDQNEQYMIKLSAESKRDRGTISFRQPHKKEGASFAFRIDFNPPINQDEIVYIKFSYRLPHFKIANMELLRAKVSKAKLEMREYEYNSIKISRCNIHKFVYEFIFDPLCKIQPKGIEVRRGTDLFIEEQENVIKNNLFRYEKNEESWRIILERTYPPDNTSYRIKWAPPSKEELSIQTSLPKRNS